MSAAKNIHLGFEIGTGKPVTIPLRNIAITGQTQESGKTTTLEALARRSGARVLTFVTKRGEGSFKDGRRVQPYFRDRADWQFVMGLIETMMQEKFRQLRQVVIPLCRTTKTLDDVKAAVDKKSGGIHVEISAYLELILPQIRQARLATSLDLRPGLNVMDIIEFSTPMQMLFVQSAIDWINDHETNTIVVVPEAWEFIPQRKESPVKPSVRTLVRKGSVIGNHIWLDSQDLAGVDKEIVRGCPVILVMAQREINEVKRNLANIPPPAGKLKPHDVQMLQLGQVFACFGRTLAKAYVQPAWMDADDARDIAVGMKTINEVPIPQGPNPEEKQVDEKEARALREANKKLDAELRAARSEKAVLQDEVNILKDQVRALQAKMDAPAPADDDAEDPKPDAPEQTLPPAPSVAFPGMDATYADVKRRAQADPGVLRLLTQRPEIEVKVERKKVEIDGTTIRGRIVKLLAEGFYDDGATNSATRTELKRTGSEVNSANVGRILSELLRDGFLTFETGDKYKAVKSMKVNVVEA